MIIKTILKIFPLLLTILLITEISKAQFIPRKWVPAITYYPCIGSGDSFSDRCWKHGREYWEQTVDYGHGIKFFVDWITQTDGTTVVHNYQPDDISEYNFDNFTSGKGKLNNQEFFWEKVWNNDGNKLVITFPDDKKEEFKIIDKIYLTNNRTVYLRGDKSTCREIPLGERTVQGILKIAHIPRATDTREPDIIVNVGDNTIYLYPDSHDREFLYKFNNKNIELSYEIFQYWDSGFFSNPNDNLCKKKNLLKSVKLIKNSVKNQ